MDLFLRFIMLPEVISTSIAMMVTWMTVIGSMDKAVHQCYAGECETGDCSKFEETSRKQQVGS
jgi:hypothetical protein